MTLRRKLCLLAAFLGLSGLGSTLATPDDGRVDLALVLAMDVSSSVDSTEHRLQMEGLSAALQSPEVLDAIRKGKHQRIAIAIYQWSGTYNQGVVVPWHVIETPADAESLAAMLATGRREFSEGGTAISASLVFGATLFDTAPVADRKVIDLATDGRNNIGRPAPEARDYVVRQGITINGLAISNEWKHLEKYLEKQVIGGNLSFVEETLTYDDFGAAMLRKLVREITGPGLT